MMAKYFGTDGVRGEFGDPHMCPAFAFRLANALAKRIKQRSSNDMYSVVLGRDTRASGQLLADALTAGFNAHAVTVYEGGVVPTPAVAKAVIAQKADLGIVITASHNPACDNGIKLFDKSGCKFDQQEEFLIEALLRDEPPFEGDMPPSVSIPLDVAGSYLGCFSALLEQDSLKGWKIVLDLANGATFQTSPSVFRGWGADLHIIGDSPDGSNINAGVGSECPDLLARSVLEQAANIGIAHDGDGDRLVVCDETGSIVDGDVLLALYGAYAMRKGQLGSNCLVATVHSNLGLDRALEHVGGKVERVDVGDRNVAARMRELGANIGGESSGHIIFSDFATTGDGLLAAIKVVELMQETGKTLSALSKEVSLFPQATKNLKVFDKLPMCDLKQLNKETKRIEHEFGQDGRLLIRYSGTEPKLRMLVEGIEPELVQLAIASLEKAARADLSVIDS